MDRSLFWAVLGFSYLSLLALIGAALVLGNINAAVLGLLAAGAAYLSQSYTYGAWVATTDDRGNVGWHAGLAVAFQLVSAVLWVGGVYLLWRA